MINNLISGLRGFSFNGKHNIEVGIVMHSKSIQSPSKKKVKDSVPFQNGSYDFSTIGSNGEITYNEREITIVLGLPAETKEQLQILYSLTLEWLEDVGVQKLKFDVTRDYFYMAEVEDSSSFEEVMEFGKLTVTFVAYPFKMSVDYVGDDIWDTFNFEEDYAQSNEFEISGTKNIILYNPRRSVNPIIKSSSQITMIKDDKSYKLNIGDNKIYGFRLDKLENRITLNGTGKVKFIFRKESL